MLYLSGVMTFAAGLMIGLALGLIVIGFLAVAAYQRGYQEAAQGVAG